MNLVDWISAQGTSRRVIQDWRMPHSEISVTEVHMWTLIQSRAPKHTTMLAMTGMGSACSGESCSTMTRRTAIRAMMSQRSEEHTSELQSRENLVCRLLLEKKNRKPQQI